MSDWILENEGLESERLFNVHTSIEYIKMRDGLWQLGNPRDCFAISEYSDEVYQQIKSVLLARNTICDEKTLRDEFAMAAMQGLIAAWGAHDVTDFNEISCDAYKLADAMLKERSK